VGFRICALLIKVGLKIHPAKSTLQLDFSTFISNFIKCVIDSKDWIKYSQNNLMEYITLCLDNTNEVEQWYVRHNYFIIRGLEL